MVQTQSTPKHTVRLICEKVVDSRRLIQETEKVVERNAIFYEKFPDDVDRVKKIFQYLKENKPRLPSGVLTPERFQQLGINFGGYGMTRSFIHENGKAVTKFS